MKQTLSALIVLLLAALLLPVVPCKLPADVWDERDFAAVKAEIAKVAGRLDGLHSELRKDSKKGVPGYNVVGNYGSLKMFHPLLASWKIGVSSSSTWAFGVVVLPDAPHVVIDHATNTARITPKECEAFLAWARTAEVDPATLTYASHTSSRGK